MRLVTSYRLPVLSCWLLVVSFSTLWAGWKKEIIYSGTGRDAAIHLVLGKGRNDDTMRIYWTSNDSLLREATYRNGGWNIDTVGLGAGPIVIALAADDEKYRVYTSKDDLLLEYSWFWFGRWEERNFKMPDRICDLASGRLRNDDTMRLYLTVGSWGGTHLYEFSRFLHRLPRWSKSLVDSGPYGFGPLIIEIGKNDDTLRIYSEASTPCLTGFYEITFSPEGWKRGECFFGPDDWTTPYYSSGGLCVGDGRGDGIVRIYAGGSFGMMGVEDAWIDEYTWVESTWVFTSLVYGWWEEPGGDHPDIGSISIGEGRGDDTIRVYAHIFGYGANPPGLHEFTYHPQGWKEEFVVPTEVWSISFGEARHNDTTHFYGIVGNSIVEFTWSLEGVKEKVQGSEFKVLGLRIEPNPTNAIANISYYTAGNEPVTLKIYDASGKLVETLINNRQIAGYQTAFWKSKKAGVYFCQLNIKDKTITRKVVVLR